MLSPSGVTQGLGVTLAQAAAKETKVYVVPRQEWFKTILFFSKISRGIVKYEGYCKTPVRVHVRVCSSYIYVYFT